MEILRFSPYNKAYELASEFIKEIENNCILESKEPDSIKSEVLKKTISDLNLNVSLIFQFGVGVNLMYPIVEGLISNMKLNIDLSIDNLVLVTITSLTICYIEESKKKKTNLKKLPSMEKDAKSLLEELKLRGIGNGIIKKIIKCFASITNIFKMLFGNTGHVFNGLLDLFSYTALLIPCMNAIKSMIGKYHLNLDSLPGNFLSLGIGITTIIAKHGIKYLIKKLKIRKNLPEIDDHILIKYPHPEFIDNEFDHARETDLIKEEK
jgi:hypothetical protein